ncbi:hypothetical protein EB796_007383 [Bugula neritina]|uniref:Uncharacterized protein n=1 Tax=Bugula neritina TaxID=10212 RepID=A0A7J7K9S7_BUGNE|nr:hypothetical protein EB796_007383 [Bugula neritina]
MTESNIQYKLKLLYQHSIYKYYDKPKSEEVISPRTLSARKPCKPSLGSNLKISQINQEVKKLSLSARKPCKPSLSSDLKVSQSLINIIFIL